MSKLDPSLRTCSGGGSANVELSPDRSRAKPGSFAARQAAQPPPERVGVLVKFVGDVSELRALGFEAPTVVDHPTGGKLAAGTISLEQVRALAALPNVIKIEKAR